MIDQDINDILKEEMSRQRDSIELIASENFASQQILEVQGSCLTNKYAEGYPGKRYYGGCEVVDKAENLAIERAKKLFKAQYANVQPHSGSQANAAVMQALIKPGDMILGMSLNAGGHLTHGASVSFSGRTYQSVTYGVCENSDIDYHQVEQLALENKPKLIIAGFSSFSGLIDWKKFREIADRVGAYLLADIAHVSGLIAVGLYPNPLPYAHVVTTTTHKTLRGPRGGLILSNHEELFKKFNFSVFPVTQGGPLMHVIAAKAVAFQEALQPCFVYYQEHLVKNARAMVEMFKTHLLEVLMGTTHNHMLVVSLLDQDIDGLTIQNKLDDALITLNRNSIPNDPRPPMTTSGLRIGTAAMTTRGFKEQEFIQVADWIVKIIKDYNNDQLIGEIRSEVINLSHKFPLYPNLVD